MMYFLLFYFFVYGGLNAYCLYKVCRGLDAGVWLRLAAVLVGALMMLGPILLKRADGRHAYLLVRLAEFAVYTWMAFMLWMFFVHLAIDVWNACIEWAAKWRAVWAPGPRAAVFLRLQVSAGRALAVSLCFLAAASVWGWFEARCVRLREVVVESDRIPAGTAPVRLAQVADLHLGRVARADVFASTMRVLRGAAADVIVSTGDLVDAADAQLAPFMAELAELQPRLGKFAVMGNHEFYPGPERTRELLRAAGFELLRGDTRRLNEHLTISGVDDRFRRDGAEGTYHDEEALAPRRAEDGFRILLKHQPAVSASARHGFDLQLSGHTHNGQIFPFGWIVRCFHPHAHGKLLSLPDGLRLYVSPGTGTWGPPFRLFAPPEVTLFIIRPRAQ